MSRISLRTGVLLGSAALALIASLLPFYKFDAGPFSQSYNGWTRSLAPVFTAIYLPLFAAAVITLLTALGNAPKIDGLRTDRIEQIAGAIATISLLSTFLGGDGRSEGIGFWLTLLAVAAWDVFTFAGAQVEQALKNKQAAAPAPTPATAGAAAGAGGAAGAAGPSPGGQFPRWVALHRELRAPSGTVLTTGQWYLAIGQRGTTVILRTDAGEEIALPAGTPLLESNS